MPNDFFFSLFDFDQLAVLMMALVLFIGLCVGSFAYRYMQGDTKYRSFFIRLVLLVFPISMMVCADNLIILFIGWCLSNMLLVQLMIHKPTWKAAKAAGVLAAKNYSLGASSIATAFTLFYWITGETRIKDLIHQDTQSIFILPALALLLIGAMTQSAIWPFHRWLLSSLNSPTPVSAIMHAGLINGGGFLLTRFAPMVLGYPKLLTVIFIVGITTALLGTLWKLMQSDVKRMLACSTMGQMGFMLAQCGLGLFPAAVAHLIWHGMFKAYLFLASGSAAQEKRYDLDYPPNLFTLGSAMLCGMAGSYSFSLVSGTVWFAQDTTQVQMILCFLAATQFALPILSKKTLRHLPLAFIATGCVGLIYGYSVHLITWVMAPMQLMKPQALNIFHVIGIAALTLAWLAMLFTRRSEQTGELPAWMLHNYVTALNASQPHPDTVTVCRNHYQYR